MLEANGGTELTEKRSSQKSNPQGLEVGDLVEISGAPPKHEIGIVVLVEYYPSNVYEKAFTACSICWAPDSRETIIDARALKRVSL